MIDEKDELELGGKSPGTFQGGKTELNNVFSNIERATAKKEKTGPEAIDQLIEDQEPNEILKKPVVTLPGYFALDIETYEDTEMKEDYREYRKMKKAKTLVQPAAIKKAIVEAESKFALSPFSGQIILVGLLDNNGLKIQFGLDGSTEKVILQDAWRTINMLMSEGYRMLSYNGKKFDLPYLFKRALIKGVFSTPTVAVNELLHPYHNHYHYDIFGVLGEQGSLEEWNYLFGFGT